MPHNVVAGHNWKRAALIVLLLVGAWLRFYALDRYPLGVHWDELSNIYDGYSIAETGADRFGSAHPAIVRAFGENDYRPAMYAWLAAASISEFGFSVKAGRIPAAVLGTASLVLLYLFASSLAGSEFGLLALLLGVLSPLHIQFSRVAHEGAILPGFFVILILYLWQQASLRKYSLPIVALLGLAIGLSANAYQATKLTAVLFCIGAGISIIRQRRPRVPALLILGACALIGAAPQILVLLADPTHFFSRARVLAIRTDSPLGYPVLIAHNYWLNLAPFYLFVPRKYEALTVARLLPPEFIFFYAGLIGMATLPTRLPSWGKWQLYFALVVALLPAAVSLQSPHPLRTSGMTVLTPLFSAAGIVWLY
jgi:4-amino-4-deoxy-L-arabinose transferase-like glycosyltransferase